MVLGASHRLPKQMQQHSKEAKITLRKQPGWGRRGCFLKTRGDGSLCCQAVRVRQGYPRQTARTENRPFVFWFRGLDKRESYKGYVKAWKKVNGEKTYIGKASPQVHAVAGGYTNHECNTRSITLNRTRLVLKAGWSARLKATLKGVKSGMKVLDHIRKVRWYSTNANVATVDANGNVNAVGKGSCTIYTIANNGVRNSAKVEVK